MRAGALRRRVAAAAFAALLFPSGSPAQQRPAAPAAEPGAELTVYLMTMGPGRLVWERFGHNAIWIHDPVRGTDETYNYGLFDFAQEHFLLRFIRGQMWYWMAGFPAERYVAQYERDNRSVWVQELELTPRQRLQLQEFLHWNEQPEHRFYHYDYYRDNCSTRVRDALDRVLNGAIQRQTAELPTGTTYRFHTQRLTSNDPLINTGLLLALGEGVDRPLSAWDEMFLPLKLREHVRQVTVPGPDGRRLPLVRSERTLFQSTAPAPPDSPPRWLSWYLAVGVAIGVLARGLAGPARERRVARVALIGLVGSWSVVIGLAGLVLAGLWGLTDHVMAYRNENLFQVNPLALLVLPALVVWARGRGARLLEIATAGVVALSALGLCLKLLPGFDQVNGPVIALALPAHLGMLLAGRRLRPIRR